MPSMKKDPAKGRSFVVRSLPPRNGNRLRAAASVVALGGRVFAAWCWRVTDWVIGLITSLMMALSLNRAEGTRSRLATELRGSQSDSTVQPSPSGAGRTCTWPKERCQDCPFRWETWDD